jgi:DNA repair protein SbcC/Rad50
MNLNPVKITIDNFQSIEHLEIEVHGFTCITGPTNAGKSAIVRAVSSAILNHPVGGMVRKGTQFCSVEINSEGWGFKWEKNDKGVNRVWIPGKDRPLDKLGQVQVPEITSMGFTSIEVGDDEIQPWFAPQFQYKGRGPLFLLDQSGPRITDFLSKVSKLNVLQDAIILAAQGKRVSTDQSKLKAEEISNLKSKLDKIIALDNLERLSKDLDDQLTSIQEYEKKIEIGENLASRKKEADRVLDLIEPAENLKIPKDSCVDSIKRLQTLYTITHDLEACADKLRKVKAITTVKEPSTEGMESSFKRLTEISKVASRIETLQKSLSILNQEIKPIENVVSMDRLRKMADIAKAIDSYKKEIADLDAQDVANDKDIQKTLEELAQIPSCPTCNRPMEKAHKHKKAS